MLARLSRNWMDVVLGALGFVFGLGSLAYPFGRDQGLYFYVAREWVVRGSIPYRDVLDHKTPGIYLLHALSILIFGEKLWGIRVFDLICVALVGFVAAELTAARGERVRHGVRGGAWLGAAVLFYGYLDFWNTAQSELWYSLFGIASVAAVQRIQKDTRAFAVSGVMAGLVMLMKPPGIWLVFLAVALLVRRTLGKEGSLRERAMPSVKALLVFGVSAAVIPALVLGYFAAKGAMPAMIDIVGGANSYYVKHERGSDSVPETIGKIILYHWCYFPLVPALLIYLVVALVRARRAKDAASWERFGVTALCCAAGYAAVIMQGKYYLLHWTVMIPPFVIILANFVSALSEELEKRNWERMLPLAWVQQLTFLYVGAMFSWYGPGMWLNSQEHAYRFTLHRESRDAFDDAFAVPGAEFSWKSSDHVGTWLREHTDPNDNITVRGFEPEIYAIAQRRHAGRFFWTTFLTNPARAYRREEWLAEDRDALIKNPPKYVVALSYVAQGPDSCGFFEALGYHKVEVMNEYTIMGRNQDQVQDAAR